ncbi:MAG: sensor histidine kinase [Saprospiraceae bacterium]|nr:sensor histidine kinase [Saprospiraceae bacterium]
MKTTPVKKISFHLTLWSVSFFLLYSLFTVDYNTGIADYIYTALFHLPLVLAVYLNLPLIQSLFLKKRYLLYLLLILPLVSFCVAFYFLIFQVLVPLLLAKYYFIAYYTPWQIAQFVIVYLFLSLLFHLSVSWFFLKEKEYQLQKENHLVQLKNLKSQISPHFLFNSLNNIYALAGPENTEARNYLTKLSDALRYIIYDTNTPFVPLKNEVEYLVNYFALERLRLENGEEVSFQKSGKYQEFLIAPLLLLPLVENCFFVHCNRKEPFIEINLSVFDSELHFITHNNKTKILPSVSGGVGLENVKKRLEMIYGNRGRLEIKDEPENFTVDLKINLEDQ